MYSAPRDGIAIHEIGPHRLEVEPSGIVHVHYFGDVQLVHFKEIDAMIKRTAAEITVYLLRDARGGGIATAETRAYSARNAHVENLAAVVTYGASFQAKTIVTMTNTAIRALRGEKAHPAFFFDTEAEARAWIEEDRRRGPESVKP